MILRLNPAYDMLSFLSPELQPQFISTVVISVVPGFQNEKRKGQGRLSPWRHSYSEFWDWNANFPSSKSSIQAASSASAIYPTPSEGNWSKLGACWNTSVRSLRLNAFRCGELSTEQGSAKIRKTAAGPGPGPSAYESGVLEFNDLFQGELQKRCFY